MRSMCRMMGAISPAHLPHGEFEAFANYAVSEWSPDGRGHIDGWGLYLDSGEHERLLVKEGRSAFGNLSYLAAAHRLEGKGGTSIVHLRNASVGSVRAENAHPFARGRLALAHNGTIHFSGADDITDSELLFRIIADSAAENGFREAFLGGIREARTSGFTGLVILATDGDALYGFRDYSEMGDYHSLHYCELEGGGTLISQVRSPGHEWREIGKGQLLTASKDGSRLLENIP